MDESYLVEVRNKYRGKKLKERIDVIQLQLFKYESERILYYPLLTQIKAAIVAFILFLVVPFALAEAISIYAYGKVMTFTLSPSISSSPEGVVISSMLLALIMFTMLGIAWNAVLEFFTPRVMMDKAAEINLKDFMKSCECHVVCSITPVWTQVKGIEESVYRGA